MPTPVKETLTKDELFQALETDGINMVNRVMEDAMDGQGYAFYNIATDYHLNKQQYDKALAWYRLSAENNYPDAQNSIGTMYLNGEGVPEDYLLAMHWFLKSAKQNYPTACWNIGVVFENGLGVPLDKYKALEWFLHHSKESDHVKELNNEGYSISKEDEHKSLEQLIKETESILATSDVSN